MHDPLFVFLVHIPKIIWAFCSLLAIVFAWGSIAMLVSRRRLRKKLRLLADVVRKLNSPGNAQARDGLTAEKLDELRVAFEELDGSPKEWWTKIDESIALYVGQNEKEGWF